MMNEPFHMILLLTAGLLLGTLFFGGLWLTVKKASMSKSPALFVFGSFIFRIAIVLFGFYYIGAGNWRSMLIAFAGFMIARFMALRFTKMKKTAIQKKEAHFET